MLISRGAAALSDFRIEKLLSQLQQKLPAISAVAAEFIHFVDLEAPLTGSEQGVLDALLHYGPSASAVDNQGQMLLVIPRFGTISPWSSKATDIAHHVGLQSIRRVERGVAYYLRATTRLDSEQLSLAASLLHDRMVESVVESWQQVEPLFHRAEPQALSRVPVMVDGRAALEQANSSLGLALADDEIDYLLDSYQQLQRDPTDVELMMFAQANSEHCRHKIFNASWVIDGEQQQHSLFSMIKNTYQQGGEDVLSAYADNAAVITGSDAGRFYPQPETGRYDYHQQPIHLLMKVETHNHPTAIAPFSGAGTGAGGEIRDEGAVGRGSKPKAGLTGFSVSNLQIPDFVQPWEQDYGKPERIVSALDIMLEGPIGSAAFNNEFGRPNLCGYFRSYEQTHNGQRRGYHKPIMIAGGYGNVRQEHIEQTPFAPGCQLIVLGGPAMQIGLGGGAASSMDSGASLEDLDFASVQRQNPEMQRRCQEVIDACWALGEDNPIAFIHDVGAGGLSNAFPELVKDGGCGGHFELRKVPNDEPGMTPLAIWCNESQERYVMAVRPERLAAFEAICERERAPYAVVGESTEAQHLRVDDALLEETPVDLPMSVLFGKPPKMERSVQRQQQQTAQLELAGVSLDEALQRLLQLPTVASKSFLITIGDRSITGMVSRDQMVGPWQVPVADSAVTTVGLDSFAGEAMSMGERTPLALINAPASGRMAIAEAITNIAGNRIDGISRIKLSANWMCAAGYESEDQHLFDTVKAVGMELCPALGLTIPVGKDSMSMRTGWQDGQEEKAVTAPLSLVVSAFAPVVDVRASVTPQLALDVESSLILIDLGAGHNRLGGSCLAQVFNQVGDAAPDLQQPELLRGLFDAVQSLLQQDLLLAYHDRSDGGMLISLLEMAFAAQCGLQLQLDSLPGDDLAVLFNEEAGAVLQVANSDLERVMSLLESFGLAAVSHNVGSPHAGSEICLYREQQLLHRWDRAECHRRWSETSYRLQALRDNPVCAEQEFATVSAGTSGLSAALTFDLQDDITAPYINSGVRPALAVLREQGVNGQLEMAAAFHRAGFDTVDVHMSDLLSGRFRLEQFNGLVACGGFSYGDVLGAGEGWAKTILFNDGLRAQFGDFFADQSRFALGVCNGCQMLSTLHSLIPGAEHWPRFVRNRSEQFEARLVQVAVPESKSILLQGMAGSHMPVVVAHGEGRAEFAGSEDIGHLQQQQQIALQYIDHGLQVAENYPANPNGSPLGITGICNGDGRITLMMPHPERVFRTVQHSWHPAEWGDDAPWLRLFRNARVWLD